MATPRMPAPIPADANYTQRTPREPVRLPGVGGVIFQSPAGSATAQQHLAAAKKAQAAGDMEAFQILMDRARSSQLVEDRAANGSPAEGMGTMSRIGAGLNAGIRSVGRHVANLVPDALGGLPDEELRAREALDAPLRDTPAGFGGAVAGEAAAASLPALGVGGAATRMGAMVSPAVGRVAASPIGRGVVEGAAQGYTMADPGDKWAGLKGGAGFGGVLPMAGKATQTAVQGMKRTPDAQALLNRGIDLTPGLMNPGGVVNQLEENATSLMAQGPAIKAARENAEKGFAQAGAREAAAPGAKIADGDPRAMLDEAYKSFDPLYDQAKGFPIVTAKGKPVIVNAGSNEPLADRLIAMTKSKVGTDKARNAARQYAENELSRNFKTSDDLLDARSSIRTKIRDLKGSTNQVDKDTAEVLGQMEQAFTDALNSQLPADALKALKVADAGYGKFKVFEDAMGRAKDRPNGFTPSNLSEAARASVSSPGAYARGAGGTPREMAQQGKAVFDQRAPVTGARLLSFPVPFLRDVAALPTTLLASTKTGRRLAQGVTAPQKKIQEILGDVTARLTTSQRRSLAEAIKRAGTTNMLRQSQDSE